MSTTVAIIEIVIIGLFGLVWLLLLAMRLTGVDQSAVTTWARDWKEWSSAVTLIGVMVIYQIGWLINGLCRALTLPFTKRQVNQIYSGSEHYEEARAVVNQRGPAKVLEDLALEQSVIRLARGGAVNFSLIALLLITGGINRVRVSLAFLFLILAVGTLLQWSQRSRRYYKRLLAAYNALSKQSP
jgi:hypothetical protein